MNATEERKKCTRCKVNLTLDKFTKKRDDTYQKQCIECREKAVEYANKNKCPHGKHKFSCKDCGGSAICEHGLQKQYCKDGCGGSGICDHNLQKHNCKQCSDAIKITINKIISHSKQKDKKYDRYDANNFIDKCFLESLIEEYPCCYYEDCKVELQYVKFQDDLATIERLDNSVGHIKSNCVICCLRCNNLKKSNHV